MGTSVAAMTERWRGDVDGETSACEGTRANPDADEAAGRRPRAMAAAKAKALFR
jgi:hypothetical protein